MPRLIRSARAACIERSVSPVIPARERPLSPSVFFQALPLSALTLHVGSNDRQHTDKDYFMEGRGRIHPLYYPSSDRETGLNFRWLNTGR